MTAIQEISFTATFPVRHAVLREGKPIETCFFQGDDLATTVHFGLFLETKLAGVISLYRNTNHSFKDKNQYQIRGMAIVKPFQKHGFGKQLIMHAEKKAKEKKGSLIWFNARESAVPFYQKLGYQITGNPFIIDDIGIHFVMKKELKDTF